MDILNIFIEIFASIRDLMIPVIAVAVISICAFLTVGPLCFGLWVNNKRFKWLGVFFDMRAPEILRTACSWIKMLVLIIYLIMFKELNVQEYILFVIPGIITALDFSHPGKIPGRFLWFVIETVGLMTASILSGYIHDMRPGIIFTIIYIAISVFLGLFGVYTFISEMGDISESRRTMAGGESIGTEKE